MRIHIACIGKLKSGAEKDLDNDYDRRIGQLMRKAGVTKLLRTERSESTRQTADQRRLEEWQALEALLPESRFTIVLDERGKSMPSDAFAALLRKQIDAGVGDMAFVIGGPDGLPDIARAHADVVLSFGAMTWPHRLVRVMLLEQIYRAITIMLQHPYHRA